MRVMIVGGGFIGGHLAGRLRAEGCAVMITGRRGHDVACDLTREDAATWARRLQGYDALVNCAGVLAAGADYDGLHRRGAIALFDGAAQAGVERVIQISALGAEDGTTAYHRSKCAADEHLTGLELNWAIVRPSLVIGRGGSSTTLFSALAVLPVIPDIGGGPVAPIAVDDVVEAVWRLLLHPLPMAEMVDAVGPEEMRIVDLISILRRWQGLGPARRLQVPHWMLRAVAGLGIGPMTHESLIMLEAGNSAPVEAFSAKLGFTPQSVTQALARHPASPGDVLAARLLPIAPALRGLLAAVWLAGGLVPLLITPMTQNIQLLARLGLEGTGAVATVWAGLLADIAIGLALLLHWRWATLAGVVLMSVYSLILVVIAPELLADPFGALVKNLAVLGLSLAVHAIEKPHA